MNWKQTTLRVVLVVAVVAVLLVGGWAIYRVGYRQGVTQVARQAFSMQITPEREYRFGPGENQGPNSAPFGGQMPQQNLRVAAVRRPSLLPMIGLGLLILGAGAVSGLVGGLVMRSSQRSSEPEIVEPVMEPEEEAKPSRGRRKKEE